MKTPTARLFRDVNGIRRLRVGTYERASCCWVAALGRCMGVTLIDMIWSVCRRCLHPTFVPCSPGILTFIGSVTASQLTLSGEAYFRNLPSFNKYQVAISGVNWGTTFTITMEPTVNDQWLRIKIW